ncbi:MAG: hypothetical protein IJ223_05075 [Clostridia bacterium]|nr:hypothetical protein [Clostridia bacterium]
MNWLKSKKIPILALIIAFLLTIFIWHNLLTGGNNIVFVFIFVAIYIAIKNVFNIVNKRSGIISGIIATLFAIVEIIGKSINYDYTLNNILDKWLIINVLGYFFIAWITIIYIFNFFENHKFKIYENLEICKNKLFSNNKFLFLLCFMLIFLAWVPYLLYYYPGILSSDSISQVEQVLGKDALSDHHPILHTAIIGIFVKFGLLISNNINFAIAIYSIVSMVIMALFCTIVLSYLKKKNAPFITIVISLLFYMFYPINGIYSITMWKDIFFSGIMPIFIIQYIELILNTENFFAKKKNIVIFVLITLFMIYIRHNGFYVFILSIPFVFILLRKYWKKLLPMVASVLILNIAINFVIYDVLKVSKISVVEMLSVPTQQIARVEKEHREELDEQIIDEINKFFKVENIGDYYNPTLSDPVKWSMNDEYFKDNKLEFINLWMNLLFKYPKEYIEAFISNSYGYYYVEAKNWTAIRNSGENELGIYNNSIINIPILDNLISMTETRNVPLISSIFSIGACFWLIIICLGYKIYKKKYKYILVYLPIFILWLTLIASPVFCEFRYAYPMFLTLPIYISMNFKNKE